MAIIVRANQYILFIIHRLSDINYLIFIWMMFQHNKYDLANKIISIKNNSKKGLFPLFTLGYNPLSLFWLISRYLSNDWVFSHHFVLFRAFFLLRDSISVFNSILIQQIQITIVCRNNYKKGNNHNLWLYDTAFLSNWCLSLL